MLEPEKQQFLIHHLAQSAADFETAIASADPAHWTTRPAPDAWSIAEIAEHVLMIDGIVVQLCAKFEEWPEEHYDLEHCARKDQLVIRVAEQRETKIQAPPQVLPTGKLSSAGEFYPGFRAAQKSLTDGASRNPELLRGRFREHPILKKLDGYQWLLVCSCHRRRHMGQIEEVKKTLAR